MKPVHLRILAVPALLLAGCSTSASSSTAGWKPPSDYEYTMGSACGEQTLLGEFRIRVQGGEVVDVAALDDRAQVIVADDELRALVPTIQGLLDEAADALRQGAEVVDVDTAPDGPPTMIEIDWDSATMDDESCYEISDYTE